MTVWNPRPVLLTLALAACATAPAPTESKPSPLIDAGARIWRTSGPELELRLIAAATDVRHRSSDRLGNARCPGPFMLCADRRPTWNGLLKVTLRGTKYFFMGDCALEGIDIAARAFVCGKALDGQRLSIEPDGDDLRLRFLENPAFPDTAVDRPETFVLHRIDPIAIAFDDSGKGENSSPETRQLEDLVKPLEKARERVKGFGPADVRKALLARKVDPMTIPLAVLTPLVRQLRSAQLMAIRLPPAEQQKYADEILAHAFDWPSWPRPTLKSSDPNPWVLAKGDGAQPSPDSTVWLSYLAAAPNEEVESAELHVAMKDLAPAWRSALQEMSTGEARRWSLPGEAAVVELALKGAWVLPPVPESPSAFPASAATAPNGMRYVIVRSAPAGAAPRPTDEVRVRHTAWNAAGRMLQTTARDYQAARTWSSLESSGTPSLEATAANLLRVGEKGRFWVPKDHPTRKNSQRPESEIAVFEVELIAVVSP